MNIGARLIGLFLVAITITSLSGCARKPAYSDMDPSGGRNQNLNKNGEAQASSTTLPGSGTGAAQPAQTPLPPFKSPTFLDQAAGGIVDLPAYPNAQRLNIQLGPIQGVNMMSLAYGTEDPMEKISAFYEKVIKQNKWTVSNKTLDREISEWNLKKGEDNIAKVQIKKDEQGNGFVIIMVRTEKLDTPAAK